MAVALVCNNSSSSTATTAAAAAQHQQQPATSAATAAAVSNSSSSKQLQQQQHENQQQQQQTAAAAAATAAAAPAPPSHNQTQQQQEATQQQHLQSQPGNRSSTISRSDHLPLIDFEHPIVAAELPDHSALGSIRQDYRYRKTPADEHYRYPKSANIEQMAAEAQTASLFRFPVEDLIQFQVDDAL